MASNTKAPLGQNVAMPSPGVPIVDPSTGIPTPTAYPFLYGLWTRSGGGTVNVSSTGAPGMAALVETQEAQAAAIAELTAGVNQLESATIIPPGLGSLLAGGNAKNSPLLVAVGNGLTYAGGTLYASGSTGVSAVTDGTNIVTGGGTLVVASGLTLSAAGTLTAGGSGGTPGGASGQIQYNNSGAFGGFTVGGDGTLVASTGTLTIGALGGKAVSLAGPLTTVGAFPLTLTTTGTTSLALPTSGTVALLANTVGAITDGTHTVNGGNTLTVASGLTLSAGGTLTASAGGVALTDGTTVLSSGTATLVGSYISSGKVLSGGLANIYPPPPALGGMTQINIGGNTTIAQSSSGVITISDAGSNVTNLRGVTLAAPGTPYRVAILVQVTAFTSSNTIGVTAGWTDGTKYDVANCWADTGSNAFYEHETWNTSTSRNAVAATYNPYVIPSMFWIGLHDDGSNVYLEFSNDGVNFITTYFGSKSGNWLGNYNTIFFGIVPNNGKASFTNFRCYDPNGLSRTMP